MIRPIQDLDLTDIQNKLIHVFNWPTANAELCCEQYKNYLLLQKKYGHEIPLPPSQCIDEAWHLHILDTRKYKKDCEDFLGRFLDHDPYYPKVDTGSPDIAGDTLKYVDMFERTQELYFQEFGSHIKEARPKVRDGLLKSFWKFLIN